MENTESYSFGKRLVSIRKFLGVTQTELSRRMGVKRPYTSKIERGEVVPYLPNISLFARCLGVPIAALVDPDEVVAFAAIAIRRIPQEQQDRALTFISDRLLERSGN